MSTRRIIQVSAYYLPHVGGQEWAVKDLATNLAANGNDVTVLTSDQGGEAGTHEENGVKVVRLKSVEFAHTAIMGGLFFELLKCAGKDDVVHVHIGQAFTPEIVWLASKFKRFKYVAQMHIEPTASGPVGSLLAVYKRIFLKRALRAASAVIVLNKEHKQIIEKKYGYRGKISVMNNGMNEEYFQLKRKPKHGKVINLFTVARFSPQKNLPMLVEALKWTRHKVHLDIIGDGEERPKIEEAIRENHLEEQVTLHGQLDRSENVAFYASCDAFVLASLYEAQPLVLLEAMASRAPIIGTNVQGIGEHIKGVGYLVEPTAASIAAGIDAFAEDPTHGEHFAEAAFKKAQAFRWSTLLKKYEAIYNEVSK
ncbi:MAG TPA: glycosyltransferase family 4 protein [Candidatus Saccharimonadales bacterium]